MFRTAWLALPLGWLLSAERPLLANSPPAPLAAQLICEPAARPGRVLCELRTRATEGTLVWSDALVVRAPSFARPLRSRVAARLGDTSAPSAARAKLALVASEPGEGQLELLARGVVCGVGRAESPCYAAAVAVWAPVSVTGAADAP